MPASSRMTPPVPRRRTPSSDGLDSKSNASFRRRSFTSRSCCGRVAAAPPDMCPDMERLADDD
eukprot:6202625-Pleurochrysis_carterae.AAC.2